LMRPHVGVGGSPCSSHLEQGVAEKKKKKNGKRGLNLARGNPNLMRHHTPRMSMRMCRSTWVMRRAPSGSLAAPLAGSRARQMAGLVIMSPAGFWPQKAGACRSQRLRPQGQDAADLIVEPGGKRLAVWPSRKLSHDGGDLFRPNRAEYFGRFLRKADRVLKVVGGASDGQHAPGRIFAAPPFQCAIALSRQRRNRDNLASVRAGCGAVLVRKR